MELTLERSPAAALTPAVMKTCGPCCSGAEWAVLRWLFWCVPERLATKPACNVIRERERERGGGSKREERREREKENE